MAPYQGLQTLLFLFIVMLWLQECMESVLEGVGEQGVLSLWSPLVQLATANAKQLQWLAVLACWSDPCMPIHILLHICTSQSSSHL